MEMEMKEKVMPFFDGFVRGFRDVAFLLLGVTNFALLSLVYFTVLAATSIAARLAGKHFISASSDRKAGSYWCLPESNSARFQDYLRQF